MQRDFLAGILIGALCGTAGTLAGRPAAPPPARVVVGLRQPWSPKLSRQLRQSFGDRLVSIAPSGSYVLLLLKPGQTLAQVRALSPAISWVEPEVVMGLAGSARERPIIIPAPRLQKGPLRPLRRAPS